ncbi:MAG: hypothetical protein HYZ14_06155 [Bacteroidetes bacterium]|nr:hypothetical protein [Bacteroidota bacterium]
MLYSFVFIMLELFPVSQPNYPESAPGPGIEKALQDSTTQVKMELHGLYEGRNLFISNPVKANGDYCITRPPELNDIIMDKVSPYRTLEIKLDEYGLELGDVIKICIWYDPECKPVVINPEVIDPSN